jgi:uncharacterized protein (DUF2252 family)
MDLQAIEHSAETRRERGRQARRALPRRAHTFAPPPRNFDPIELITEQNAGRIPELVPVRHERMAKSAFAFYRGTALIMAADLATLPHTGLFVQLCGDAHLSNFGAFASPERTLLFDVNDFDETLPGPFEWDLKRLTASAVLAARDNGLTDEVARAAAFAAAEAYAENMSRYATMGELDVWYSHVTAEELEALVPRGRWRKRYRRGLTQAQQRDSLWSLSRLAEPFEGELRIKDRPPLIRRIDDPADRAVVERFIAAYQETLQESRRALLDRYRLVSAAYKAVGVGSVGTRCFVGLFMGRDQNDPLFLQVKEATSSVLERYLPSSKYSLHGERVVTGQRIMQAASDIFLGWARSEAGIDYYVRQLRDWKASVDVAAMDEAGLVVYSRICGRTLARAHARAGDAISIAGYIGASDRFARALTEFGVAYASQAEEDYRRFCAAIEDGRLPGKVKRD